MTSSTQEDSVSQISEDAAFFDDDEQITAYNRVWFNIMRVHRHLQPKIAKALKQAGINDPIWYEILLEVERSGERGQLMGALEEKLYVPQYALSRHISRMEKAGLLRREYIADGKRKQVLFLTEKGIGMHANIWPVYHDAMQAALAHTMDTDDAYRIARLLIHILAAK
ncbi:MarR family winged helix-turn-helix transcriptional regulator [Shimia sp. CNT1-13L.2]|uniref:MarR family winged helix-turn-helix transcriptional regulator n=1 Tax=Shimia sp. CNT1-13L.2 TaxID=2959663 RepID=UPI0020CEEC4C|nr:MarR family winged helix-turn-helix transcriptional regulator [Shimia sp. CNT1-13L.2]MCP9484100.1 MarR family winged helix-turn-helix transcriptional regulator [Shimia sp. CNT1-13L.2]